MSLSLLPLSYCTNVHAGRSLAEVEAGLVEYAGHIRRRVGVPVAAGLWLAAPVIRELREGAAGGTPSAGLKRLKNTLEQQHLACYTLNAFPYGDFHSTRVKDNVYLPDWTTAERFDYTRDCAQVLSELLPPGVDGSISTLPLGFKGHSAGHAADFPDQCIARLLALAAELHKIEEATGSTIRLGIEPEPFCLLETTEETIAFFSRLWDAADKSGIGDVARRHLGVCYDVCHQAVEFENIAASIGSLGAAGIRINKLHITCALQLDNPASNQDGRELLAQFAEERYLHQTMGRLPDGRIVRHVDLTAEFAAHPPADFLAAEQWRIHFHVPVNLEAWSSAEDAENAVLRTTRLELREALAAVAKLDYAPHLEVETYTWPVFPGSQTEQMVQGLTTELQATRELLHELSPVIG